MIPSPRVIDPASPLNIVCDGNSLGAGQGASQTLAAAVAALLAGSFASVSASSVAISGQSVQAMINSAADVDASFIAGKINILLAWETTNSIASDRITPAQTAAAWQSYYAARLAVHPGWKIIHLGTIPRQGGFADTTQPTIDAGNAALVQADALIQAAYRGWGVKRYVDLRGTGSPFRYRDFSATTFAENDDFWNEPAGGRIHLHDAGQKFVSGLVAGEVRRLAA